nr:cytokine receptor family member b2 [Ictalurus punctatus]
MDHVYTLLMLIVPCSVLCGHVPAPVNLTMDSQNFVHLLTWKAGPGSPAGLQYRVLFRSYSVDWKMVDSCAAVCYPLRCNLTDVFTNLEEAYYIKVTAVLGKEMSAHTFYNPFKPEFDTWLEPPSLRLSPCNDSLCVYLQSPSERLDTVYKKYNYVLNVTNEKGVQVFLNTRGLGTVVLKVVPGLQYCVSVNITDRKYTSKPPVCATKPAAVNSMDPVISGVLSLLGLVIVVTVIVQAFKRSILLKTHQPLVLSSFNAPYKVQLLTWPSVESLHKKCILLEHNTNEDVQVNEEVDQEKADEEVAYEGRRGCEQIDCCEEISEETKSSIPGSPEIPYEHTHNSVTETYPHVPGTFLKEHTLTPDMIRLNREATTPQTTGQIRTTHFLPLKTPIQKIKKNDLALLRHKRGDEIGQEEEGSDNVNFFSLTLGGQNSEQEEETEENMENVKQVKPEVPLFVFGPPKPAMNVQPTYSESTNKCISYSEEEDQEDTEEEEAFCGYMMRR